MSYKSEVINFKENRTGVAWGANLPVTTATRERTDSHIQMLCAVKIHLMSLFSDTLSFFIYLFMGWVRLQIVLLGLCYCIVFVLFMFCVCLAAKLIAPWGT